jgi:hypothetical protein
VLALYDLTFFGSAKDAVVFGIRGVYYKHKDRSLQLPYRELSTFKIEPAPEGIKLSRNTGGQLPGAGLMTLGTLPADTAKIAEMLKTFGSFAGSRRD